MAKAKKSKKSGSERVTILFVGLSLAVLAAVVFAAVIPKAGSGTDSVRLSANPVGEEAPSLAIQLLGSTSKFDDSILQGKVVVVNFWASWCPPCNQEAPALAQASIDWQSNGVQFVGIDSQDSTANGLGFISNYNWQYPVVEDPDALVMAQWGVTGLPVTFVVAADGTVSAKHSGQIDSQTLDSLIEDALNK